MRCLGELPQRIPRVLRGNRAASGGRGPDTLEKSAVEIFIAERLVVNIEGAVQVGPRRVVVDVQRR